MNFNKKRTKKSFLAIVMASASFSLPVFAGEAPIEANNISINSNETFESHEKNLNTLPIENFFKDKNVKILKKQELSDKLVGYLVDLNGHKSEVYTNKEGNLILNNAIDVNTLKKLENIYSDKLNPVNYNKQINNIEKLNLNIHSNPKLSKKLYIFSGSLCPHCSELYEILEENDIKEKYDIVSIPVAYNSNWKVAWLNILSKPKNEQEKALNNTYKLINNNEKDKIVKILTKSYKGDKFKELSEKIDKITSISADLKVTGTPTIFIKDYSGKYKILNFKNENELIDKLQ